MTQLNSTPKLPSDNRGKFVIIGGAAAVVVVGLIGWRVWANRAPSLDASRKQLETFVASDKFDKLPAGEKKEYTDALASKPLVLVNGKEIDGDQLEALRKQAEQHRKDMLDEYFKLQGQARLAYLDKMIDQQESVKKMMDAPPSTQPGQMKVTMKMGGSGAAGQKRMMETIPPDAQAQMAQFVKDINDRRAQRGLPPQQGFMMVKTSTSMSH
jgi:hypothetical protein